MDPQYFTAQIAGVPRTSQGIYLFMSFTLIEWGLGNRIAIIAGADVKILIHIPRHTTAHMCGTFGINRVFKQHRLAVRIQ